MKSMHSLYNSVAHSFHNIMVLATYADNMRVFDVISAASIDVCRCGIFLKDMLIKMRLVCTCICVYE